MVLNLKKDRLIDYPKINHCLYLTEHGTIYKNCEESLNNPDLLEERLSYVNEIPCSQGFTKPISLLRDESIYGYEMIFLKDYVSIIDYIVESSKSGWTISFDEKKDLMIRLLKCLRDINKYYAVSDISLSNIMINPNGGSIIIDWENGTPLECDYPTLSLYRIANCSNEIQADSIKMFICALSLLYEIDFEAIFENMSIQSIEEILHDLKVDKNIMSFLSDVSYENIIRSKIAIYFDDYLKHMKPISEFRRVLVMKGVKKLYER